MTKTELEAENTRLKEENEALRALLGAVQAMADAPKPAGYEDRYYWACTDRLSTIKVWAHLDENASGPNAAAVMRGWAESLRKKAAEPVRYEVKAAEPEPVSPEGAPEPPAVDAGEGNRELGEPGRELLREAIAEEDAKVAGYEYREPPAAVAAEVAKEPNPPYHVDGLVFVGPSCGAEDSNYICNAQAGHDGPDHVAYGTGGQECYRWPVSVALRIGGNLVPLRGES